MTPTIARWEAVNEAAFQEVEPSAESQAYCKTVLSLIGVKSCNGKRKAAVGSSSVLQSPSPSSEGGADVLADQQLNAEVSQHSDDVVEHSQLSVQVAPLGTSGVPAKELRSVLPIKVGGGTPKPEHGQ